MSASYNPPFHQLAKTLTTRFKFARLVHHQTKLIRDEVIIVGLQAVSAYRVYFSSW